MRCYEHATCILDLTTFLICLSTPEVLNRKDATMTSVFIGFLAFPLSNRINISGWVEGGNFDSPPNLNA